MRKLIMAALLGGLSLSSHAELMVIDSTEWGDSTYYLLEKSNWFDAQTQAAAMGGNLVTMNTEEENYFIYDLWGAQGTSPYAQDYLWLGLTDQDDEGNFTWVSGETVTYTNFKPGEPNGDTTENHVYMWYRGAGTEGTWNDFRGESGVDYYDGVYGVVEINHATNSIGVGETGSASAVPLTGSAVVLAGLALAGWRRRK